MGISLNFLEFCAGKRKWKIINGTLRYFGMLRLVDW